MRPLPSAHHRGFPVLSCEPAFGKIRESIKIAIHLTARGKIAFINVNLSSAVPSTSEFIY